jgi:hypothetical protein
MARHEGKQIGGRSHDPVQWDFKGDITEARKHMGIGRQLLGDLKHFVQLSEIQTHTWRRTLRNGVVVVAMTIMPSVPGMADIDKISIYAPPSSGDIVVYGFIVHDFTGGLVAVSPSGKEVGETALDDGETINWNNYTLQNFAGYPDGGARYIPLNLNANYQWVYFNRWQHVSRWENVERIEDWEAAFPYWPPPHDPPAPVIVDDYTDPQDDYAVAFHKRTDNYGFWHSSPYEVRNGVTRILDPFQEYGITNLLEQPFFNPGIRDTPWLTTKADHIFIVPMVDAAFEFSDAILTDNTSHDENFVYADIYEQGSDGEWYTMFDLYETIDYTMTPAFTYTNKVEQGKHKVIQRIPPAWGVTFRNMDVVVELFTSRGKFLKKYGGDQQTQLQDEEVVLEILVGPVKNLDEAIQLKASPTN